MENKRTWNLEGNKEICFFVLLFCQQKTTNKLRILGTEWWTNIERERGWIISNMNWIDKTDSDDNIQG